MDLKLVICFALCHLAQGRPRLGYDGAGIQEAISNLQLLIPLLLENSLDEQREAESSHPRARSQAPPAQSQAYPGPTTLQKKPQNIYSLDGPFSDIPADAFQLEHRKEFKQGGSGRVTKKDLSRETHKRAPSQQHDVQVPRNMFKTCLNYFQGKAQPQPNSMEVLLNICTELLGEVGVEDFGIGEETRHDEKRQQKYDLKSNAHENEQHHHHHHLNPDGTLDCECCPSAHKASKALARNDRDREDDRDDDRDDDRRDEREHDRWDDTEDDRDYDRWNDNDDRGDHGDDERQKDREDDRRDDREDDREDEKNESLLEDIFRWFRPVGVGQRRGWSVIKTKNPDKRLKQYVAVDSNNKNPFIV